MSFMPHHTRDTTAAEAVMDLDTGIEILINHIEILGKSLVESNNDRELMDDMQPVIWLALRLQNDIADVLKKVEDLHRSVAEAEE
jgi:hypothetical protein